MPTSPPPFFRAPHAWLGVFFALLAAVGFSGKAILVKLAYQHGVDSVTLLALRMGFALPFFVAIAVWVNRQNRLALTPHDRYLIVGLGFVGYYLSSLLDFLGLQYISAGLERLILFLYPTMTVVLSALLEKRAIGRRTLAAMALCYVGIALVFAHDMDTQARNLLLGASLVFASTLSYSVYLVGAGHAIARMGALRFTAYTSAVASGMTLLQFVVMRPLTALDLPMQVYALSLAMAIFSTVLPVFLLSLAIRQIGAGRTALLGSIGPIATIYMAYLFLHETISLLQIMGSALVLAGVLLIARAKTHTTVIKNG
jgi:drug/metabolite transporter (DMT)-like permease